MNNYLGFALVGLVAVATSASFAGDHDPSGPITIIVPTTAGGPPDTIARFLGERMKLT
jgi:tripartite-type tricarboxylate transporter receptor subunit TctC